MQRLSVLRNVTALAGLMAASTLASAHGRDPYARSAVQNGWRSSWNDGVAEAKKSGKPIMLVLRCFD